MRPPDDLLDNVEIVEPPLEELTRKGSFFKQTCFTGCGCIVLFIIIFFVGIRIFLGSGPKTVKTIPHYFPTNIPLYDKDAIEDISILPEKYEKRSITLALFFPKIILAPLINTTAPSTTKSTIRTQLDTYLETFKTVWQEMQVQDELYATIVTIEWRNAEADPNFMMAYYQNELKKNNFTITIDEDKKNPMFSFTGPEVITGSFIAQKKEVGSGTSYAQLKVTLPSKVLNTSPNDSKNTSSTLLIQPHDQTITSPSL